MAQAHPMAEKNRRIHIILLIRLRHLAASAYSSTLAISTLPSPRYLCICGIIQHCMQFNYKKLRVIPKYYGLIPSISVVIQHLAIT